MLHIEYFKHLSALIDNPVFFAFFLAVLIDVMTGFVKSLVNKMGIPIPSWLKKYIYKLSDDYRGDDDEK